MKKFYYEIVKKDTSVKNNYNAFWIDTNMVYTRDQGWKPVHMNYKIETLIELMQYN